MKKVVYILLELILALNLFLVSGCNNQITLEAGEKKTIVAVTILPQKAFVKAVGGDLLEVITIVPPGNSPGNYEPTPQEMENFSKASVYFTIGVPAEEANILPKANDMRIVDLSAQVAAVYPDREFNAGQRDSHIWLSPKRARVMVEAIAKTMADLDAENAQFYLDNAEAFLRELDRVDAEIIETFASIQNRTFIVFHPAYGYFADDYGLQMYSLEEDGKEATPQHLQDMIDLAKAEHIQAIFSQAEIDSKQLDAFAEEIEGEKIMLDPLSDDYIANLEHMAEAISGSMK